MAKIFIDLGYEVQQTNYSGDFGADLIVEKDDQKIAVQIKRYSETTKVGVQDINQVIGARNYYQCNKAIIATTSTFSMQGIKLAEETSVELWDWDQLIKTFKALYWNGKDYYSFYSNLEVTNNDKEPFNVSIESCRPGLELKGGSYGTFIYMSVQNTTQENIGLYFSLPTLITTDFDQIECSGPVGNCFSGGVIYAGCKVKIGYCFPYPQVRGLKIGDKIISRFTLGLGGTTDVEKEYISIYAPQQSEILPESFPQLEQEKSIAFQIGSKLRKIWLRFSTK